MNHRPSAPLRCLIVTSIFPPDIGGPARFVPEVARALATRGFQCEVVTYSENGGEAANSATVPVHRIRRRQNLLLRELRTIGVLLRRARMADVLFVNGLYWESALAGVLAARPMILKLVSDEVWERATARGWTREDLVSFQRVPGDWRIRALRALRLWALRRARVVIVPSEFTRSFVLQWGSGLPPVQVVPNAVEAHADEGVPSLPDHLLGLRKVVTAGRLIALKRIDVLIQAVHRLPRTALIIVGDGPERPRLQALSGELDMADRVVFTGAVPGNGVQSLLGACDVFVLNSSIENFPHGILEAMSAGVPVVSTSVGGIPEVLRDGDNGILIEPGPPEELAETIRQVMEDPGLRARLREGMRRTLDDFRWDRTVDRVAGLLRLAAEAGR